MASAQESAIGTHPDLDCVGTAATVDGALAQMAASKPDVVLMDIQLPGTDGIEGTRRISASYSGVSILILTAGAPPPRVAGAGPGGGGRGFFSKQGVSPPLSGREETRPGTKRAFKGATPEAVS